MTFLLSMQMFLRVKQKHDEGADQFLFQSCLKTVE